MLACRAAAVRWLAGTHQCSFSSALPLASPHPMLHPGPAPPGILALPRVFSLLGIGTATLWVFFIGEHCRVRPDAEAPQRCAHMLATVPMAPPRWEQQGGDVCTNLSQSAACNPTQPPPRPAPAPPLPAALLSYASMHMLTKASARTGLASYRCGCCMCCMSMLVPGKRTCLACLQPGLQLAASSREPAALEQSPSTRSVEGARPASTSLPAGCSDLVRDRLGLFAQVIHDLAIITNCFGGGAGRAGLPCWRGWRGWQLLKPCLLGSRARMLARGVQAHAGMQAHTGCELGQSRGMSCSGLGQRPPLFSYSILLLLATACRHDGCLPRCSRRHPRGRGQGKEGEGKGGGQGKGAEKRVHIRPAA